MAVVTGFWHVGITVADMDRSLAFYRDGLGLEPASRPRRVGSAGEVWGCEEVSIDVVYLSVPGSSVMLELVCVRTETDQRNAAARPWDSGSGHFSLLVDDLDSLYQRLHAAGHRSRSGHVTRITTGPFANSKVAYLIDPDGYHVEVFERAS